MHQAALPVSNLLTLPLGLRDPENEMQKLDKEKTELKEAISEQNNSLIISFYGMLSLMRRFAFYSKQLSS